MKSARAQGLKAGGIENALGQWQSAGDLRCSEITGTDLKKVMKLREGKGEVDLCTPRGKHKTGRKHKRKGTA